jgi:dimethylaniline monooxygenase (N-oxide forming)
VYEVCAHWIASYFRKDSFLRLPPSAEAAIEDAEKNNSWLRQRFPGMLGYANEAYAADMAMFGYVQTQYGCTWELTAAFIRDRWPQIVDTLLEDMSLPIMRSGGSWLTWPFAVIDLKEIEKLKEERELKRAFTAMRT